MHTIGTYGYAISMTFALLTLLIATLIALYAGIKLIVASFAVVETPQGSFAISKEEISVNWSFPGAFLIGAVLWTLIALGFHRLL